MKILCINSNGLFNDGITNSILNYYSHMERDRIEIHVLDTKATQDYIKQRIKDIGLEIKYTDNRSKPINYLVKTAKLIRKERYDIVHVHGSSSLLTLDLLAAKLGGCRVRIAHSRNTTCDHRIIDRLLRPVFYGLCNVRFACGEEAGKWLFGRRSFIVIKNGKDLQNFSFRPEVRKTIRNEYGWNGKTVIGHVGNFNYQKNHGFLIDVFSALDKEFKNYLLVLVGSGVNSNEYMEKVKEKVHRNELDNKVVFLGSISNVSEVIQGMDIMLLPSRFEGLPNVVLEWQAEGLPCIISDKITKECAVTDLVQFLPIDNGVDAWTNAIKEINIVDRNAASRKAHKALRENGFDIVKDAAELRQIYYEKAGEG